MDEDYNWNYDDTLKPEQNNNTETPQTIAFALISFILAFINVFCCMCSTSYFLATLSIIFGIISIAKKKAGKALAVIGIIISSIALAFTVYSHVKYGEITQDMINFIYNGEYYVSQYEETGEIPEEFQKYKDSKYDEYWKEFGVSGFEEAYKIWVKWFKLNVLEAENGQSPYQNDDDGSQLVDISFKTVLLQV